MTLLLFDIDGTLVRVHGTGRIAITQALSALNGRFISTEAVSFSGRTDPAIFEAILAENDLPTTEAAIETAIEAYVDTMRTRLSQDNVEVLPGVSELLAELHAHPDVHLGLVTGNVKPIAYEKLSVHGLDDYFPIGAFGSDHADRNRLPALATQRAAEHTDRPLQTRDHVVVIGDTVHDIECARFAGAGTVAVCTGRYDRNELSRHTPDLLFDTLPAPESFCRQVLEGLGSTPSE